MSAAGQDGVGPRCWPSVSVVVPTRNEADFIERSLGALVSQQYSGLMEFICVDAMSDDGTREIVARMGARDPRIRLVDNPDRITPAGMNRGISAARYELVLRMDAHAVAEPGYIRRSVELMTRVGADNVGGRWTIEGSTYSGRAIAAAMTSRFGVGTARWRSGTKEAEVDTVPFGCWRRELLLELGGFDESLVRNQDYEFNSRIRARGGKVCYSPRIHSRYFTRKNLKQLGKQYYDYGVWKARVIKRDPRSAKARHLAAPLFVLGLAAGLPAALSLPASPVSWAYWGGVALYGAANLAASIERCREHGWDLLPMVPLVFTTLHLSWGAGFWVGLVSRDRTVPKTPLVPPGAEP